MLPQHHKFSIAHLQAIELNLVLQVNLVEKTGFKAIIQ